MPRSSIEHAYLFFAILAFLIEIALLIIHLLEVQKLDALSSLPWNLIVRLDLKNQDKIVNYSSFFLQLSIKDAVFVITLFSLSIAAAVFESYQRNYNYMSLGKTVYVFYNSGAYAAAAVTKLIF